VCGAWRGGGACSGGRSLRLVHPLKTHNRTPHDHQRNSTRTLKTLAFICIFQRGGVAQFYYNVHGGGGFRLWGVGRNTDSSLLPHFPPLITLKQPPLYVLFIGGLNTPRAQADSTALPRQSETHLSFCWRWQVPWIRVTPVCTSVDRCISSQSLKWYIKHWNSSRGQSIDSIPTNNVRFLQDPTLKAFYCRTRL